MNLKSAIEYNSKVSGKFWTVNRLPDPLVSAYNAGDTAFAHAVAAYQSALNLVDDGKLGPGTWAAIRAMPPRAEDPSCRDFPGEADEQPDDEHDPLDEVHLKDSISSGRLGVSNNLIINGAPRSLENDARDEGISCSNWMDDGEKHFRFRARKDPVTHLVIHESVTTSIEATNRALDSKRRRTGYDFGIHFNIAADGHIVQHNDPVLHRLVHANQLNNSSCGVEVTNPYNPKFGGAPWTETIASPWWCWRPKGADRVYTKPTPAQMRATVHLCKTLIKHCPDLPQSFPTQSLGSSKRRIDGWNKKVKPGAGIVAHRDFSTHADGRFLLEHVIKTLAENSIA